MPRSRAEFVQARRDIRRDVRIYHPFLPPRSPQSPCLTVPLRSAVLRCLSIARDREAREATAEIAPDPVVDPRVDRERDEHQIAKSGSPNGLLY